MRKYEKPEMEILFMNEVEVITTSNTGPTLNIDQNGGLDKTDWSDLF